MVRLNLGAGKYPVEGYLNLDRQTGNEAYPLPYDDNSVDAIRASHVLEHFSHRDIRNVMAEWVRVLKPGGVLKVAVPDFDWCIQKYTAGERQPFEMYIMGGHVDEDDRHGSIFTADKLRRLMKSVGLVDIEPWESEIQDCASLPVSLNLQGTKPEPLPQWKVRAILSAPRFGPIDHAACCHEALTPLGIRPKIVFGALWGQCLERGLEDIVNEGVDYILTLDYDSVFARSHVEALLRLAAKHPEADAIAATQLKRHDGSPLMSVVTPEGKTEQEVRLDELDKPLFPVASAHFGLTLIKAEALKRLPHPWFKGEPNAEGRWDTGKTDDDIWFWRKWREIGNTAFVANRVVIGHMQPTILWPDSHFRPIHQHPSDFWKSGPPRDARWQ